MCKNYIIILWYFIIKRATMVKKVIALVIFLTLITSVVFFYNDFSYRKISNLWVVDGDTIHGVDEFGNKQKIRLKGIDCHETRYNPRADFQSELYGLSLDEIYALGKKEKRYLINFVKDKRDRFYYKDFGKDKYDRVLGVLYLDKKINVNKMLLDEGVCPVYVARKK